MAHELLTPDQMAACDRFTIAAGTPGAVLMDSAGRAVADEAMDMVPSAARILVLAGPGNNGGDGYVAARYLAACGHDVTVASLGDPDALTGDARLARQAWKGGVQSAEAYDDTAMGAHDLVIDALFGAGLARPLEGVAAHLVEALHRSKAQVLAVDLPSGLDGGTGKVMGCAVQAVRTVTFHRLKLGHALYPGRALCGRIRCADIGLHPDAIAEAGFSARLTAHYLSADLQEPMAPQTHKYRRGHAVVVGGGPERAGAGFLAGSAALRAGAGLVTMALPTAGLSGSLGVLPALMRAPCDAAGDLARLLDDPRHSVCALGPGLPPTEHTRQMVYAALQSQAVLVLDAGALTAFAGMAVPLFDSIKQRRAPVVLTPHEGEFARLFGALLRDHGDTRLDAARAAASLSGALMVLKGPDTVIAHPDGSAQTTFLNANAPPWLATAGSGDVLTGILAGLLASPGLAQASAHAMARRVALAVWLHGEAALDHGPSLVASDLEAALARVMNRLIADTGSRTFEPLPGA